MNDRKGHKSEFDRVTHYVIQVRGLLPDRWQAWFEGMSIDAAESEAGQKVTIISGPVRDQSALFGILERIRDLGLTLLEVHSAESFPADPSSQFEDWHENSKE